MSLGPGRFPVDTPVQALTSPTGADDLRVAISWRQSVYRTVGWWLSFCDQVGLYAAPVAVVFLLIGVPLASGMVAVVSVCALISGEFLFLRREKIATRIARDVQALREIEP